MECHGRTGPITTKTIFGKCGDKTDENKLKDLLEVTKRQDLRIKIRDLKKVHVEWLQGKVNGNGCNPPRLYRCKHSPGRLLQPGGAYLFARLASG